MLVEFVDARLKRLCADRAARQRQWQKAAAASLGVLRSLPGKWEEPTGSRKGQLSCRLDWRAVDAVTVLDVENDHD